MIILPSSLKIGVLRGGTSKEYDVSLKTGGYVLSQLGETHRPLDILISKDGKWHIQGIERSPERILKHVDVIFNALHGTFGEDGGVQEFLDNHGVPYTGSGRLSSAIAMNKWLTKERVKNIGIKTPIAMIVRREDPLEEKAKQIFERMPHPLIVKPACEGSSLGIYIVRNFHELYSALSAVLEIHGSAIVEEYISGKSISCLVTDNFRGKEIYTFPPLGSEVSAHLSKVESEKVQSMSKVLHDELGLRHYSKSDFIVSPKRGVYFLETNTLPKFKEKSHLVESLESVGVSVKDYIHHILHLAVNKTGIWP